MRVRLAVLLVCLAATHATAGVLELSLGGTMISANGGGESLTKRSGGLGLSAGYGTRIRDDLMIVGRMLAGFAIEDEQHAHDDVIVAATARLGRAQSRGWIEGGLGVGFYRGRYRYDSFFDSANYDSEIATPTLVLGGGLVLHRSEAMTIFARLDGVLSPFGSEVSTSMVQLTFGTTFPL